MTPAGAPTLFVIPLDAALRGEGILRSSGISVLALLAQPRQART